jgi:hypothetical protein
MVALKVVVLLYCFTCQYGLIWTVYGKRAAGRLLCLDHPDMGDQSKCGLLFASFVKQWVRQHWQVYAGGLGLTQEDYHLGVWVVEACALRRG